MATPNDDPTTFALALTRLDGVGRVTARRLTEHFDDYDDLRRHSREQVFLRIKGVPNAEKIAERLFDEEPMRDAFAEAKEERAALSERGVHLLSPHSEAWPAGLGALASSERPLLLWAHGPASVLHQPMTALLARPPLEEAPFERAQALAQHLTSGGVAPVLGAQSGFDVAIAKRAAGANAPVVLVAACGLARLPRKFRPVASQVVRAGGLLLSPFPMPHGPFDHDDRERAHVQAALAGACVFAPPAPDTSEASALTWATDAGRSVFVLSDEAPDGANPVRDASDFTAVLDAAQNSTAPA